MKWNKKTDSIFLAVGHGIQLNGVWDSGCAYGKYTEADLMLPIVKAAVSLLRKSGVKVYTDADKDNNKNMIATVTEANKKKVTLYMSVHCDYKDAKTGVDPLYVSSKGKKFGEYVGKYVAKAMGMKFYSTKRTDLYELNNTDMPSCILETGAIKVDLDKIKQSKKYGRAIAKAICKYIGVEVYVSNRTKMARKANELAYAGHPAKAKYPSGKPKPAYKKALNKVFPKRGTWGKAPRAGASCDVFMATVARASGVDPNFPRSLSAQVTHLEKSNKWKRIKKADVKTGDLIMYKRNNGNGHICMYHKGKIKHASLAKWYGRTTNNAKSMMSTTGRKWVRYYRAVG